MSQCCACFWSQTWFRLNGLHFQNKYTRRSINQCIESAYDHFRKLQFYFFAFPKKSAQPFQPLFLYATCGLYGI